MADWKDDKNLGPWPFVPQPNKWGYLNNPRWTNPAEKFVKGGTHDYDGRESAEPQIFTPPGLVPPYSRGSESTHFLCGHWHKKTTEVAPPDDIYLIHGAPIPYALDLRDRCYKRTKNLAEIIWYGGFGTGLDQLMCPYGIAVDATHAWICDSSNSRLMQRLKSDLTYVQHRGEPTWPNQFHTVRNGDFYSVHARVGDLIWVGGVGEVRELYKVDLSDSRSISWPACGVEGYPGHAYDITSDDVYLYVADKYNHRIVYYRLSSLAYAGEFGTSAYWCDNVEGLVYYGGYLYVSDLTNSKIFKVDPSDYSKVASYGHINGGSGAGYTLPHLMAINANYLFIADENGLIAILDHNLNYVSEFSTGTAIPYAIAVDANYIYVADFGNCEVYKYDIVTHALLATSPYVFSLPEGIATDGTYVYVLDQDSDLNVVRLLVADLSYVDKYSDVGWSIFTNPQALHLDGNYLYVSDNGQGIHRIDKTTMAYVDLLVLSDTSSVMQIAIDSGILYTADYSIHCGVQKYNLGTLVLIDKSPLTYGDPNLWMEDPSGITCDAFYIYLSDAYNNRIKIYDKSTHEFIAEIIAVVTSGSLVTQVQHLAVDDLYLFATFWGSPGFACTKKYLKTLPLTELASVDDQYAIGIDTAYIYQV